MPSIVAIAGWYKCLTSFVVLPTWAVTKTLVNCCIEGIILPSCMGIVTRIQWNVNRVLKVAHLDREFLGGATWTKNTWVHLIGMFVGCFQVRESPFWYIQKYFTRWWFQRFGSFFPLSLGKMNPIWQACFSNGLVKNHQLVPGDSAAVTFLSPT